MIIGKTKRLSPFQGKSSCRVSIMTKCIQRTFSMYGKDLKQIWNVATTTHTFIYNICISEL